MKSLRWLLLLLLLLSIFVETTMGYKSQLSAGFEPEFFDINIDRSHPEKVYKQFEAFVVKYNRTYRDAREKKLRFNYFVSNLNAVGRMQKEAQNAGVDTKFGINKFGDMNKAEFQDRLSKVPPGNYSKVPVFNLKNVRSKRQMDNLPVKFDLRNKKIGGRYIIGPVKNQGHCSCCWAFAATAVAEAAYSVHQKMMTSLSDQEVCDCGAKSVPGCQGGDPTLGLEYIADMGLSLESEYKYVDGRASSLSVCAADKHDRKLNAYVLDYYRIDPFNAEYQIMRHLYYLNTPVAVAFRIGDGFRYYESGVLEMADCNGEPKDVWHSGAIVGYGTTRNSRGKSLNYWIVKNSWDSDWGEEGYVRVARGRNWCSVESQGTGARIPE